MRLLLSSFGPSPAHDDALVGLVGKPLAQIRVAYIDNAYDVYADQASLDDGREGLGRDGYVFELVDLREWRADRDALRGHLERFDAFLLTGGNPYYLRSLMKIGEGCRKAGDLCERDGFIVQRVTDAQALVIDGEEQRMVGGA